MTTINVPVFIQEGNAGTLQNSRETLINMYAEMEPAGAERILRRQRPGLIATRALSGEKRCIERHKGDHYLIVGATLYKYSGDTLTTLGTLNSIGGRCYMVFNDNDQIMISDGSVAYYWNGTALQLVTLPAGVSCGTLTYISGYAVFNQPGTGKFWITAPNDFSSVDALDFATAESCPDNLVRVFVNHNELWLAGVETTEIWQLSGGTDFPFTAYTNAQIERGCGAAFSYASEDNTLFFLGDDGIVYRADGYRPVRVSTTAEENAIAAVTDAGRAAAYSHLYTWRGSKFLTMTFGNELTLQLSIGSGLWNRAKTFGLDYWDTIGSNGHHSDYVLTTTGIAKLGKVNTDEGATMYRGGVTSPLVGMPLSGRRRIQPDKRLTFEEFFLDAEVGRAGQGITPQVMLRFAPDGETFGNERWRNLGTTGAYGNRAMWRNLGQGRKPVIELGVTGDFEWTIMNTRAAIDIEAD